MFRILKADKDSMICDKVINGKRVRDANTGQAGTLDLFKLYQESNIDGEKVNEISRILIHFDLDPLRALTGSSLDLDDTSFTATIKMKDVDGGQTTPSNFTIAAFPLVKEFDEGNGFDIASFRDIDAVNFITATVSTNPVVIWSISGANDPVNDYVEASGSFQSFTLGTEDLSIDVTSVISSTLKGDLSDYGFRISFSGTQETDNRTRFVKRFTSRQASDPSFRPTLEVKFSDVQQDDHRSFLFGVSGSLFLNNVVNGQLADIPGVTGADSLFLRLTSGTNVNQIVSGTFIVSGTEFSTLSGTVVDLSGNFYEKILTASQYQVGSNFITGVYVASFAVESTETGSLKKEVINAGSGTFTEIWGSLDDSTGFFTSSLVIEQNLRTTALSPSNIIVRVINNEGDYEQDEVARFRLYVQINQPQRIVASRVPLSRKSEIMKNMFFQVVDANSKNVIIPYDVCTRLSTDSDGMYFDLFMEDLDPGIVYGLEFKISETGVTQFFSFEDLGSTFRVNT